MKSDVKFLFGMYPYDEILCSGMKYATEFGEVRSNFVLLLRGKIIGFGYKLCDIPGLGGKRAVERNMVEVGVKSVSKYFELVFKKNERDKEFVKQISKLKYFEGKLPHAPYKPIFETLGRENDGSRYKICENPWYGVRNRECRYSIRKDNVIAKLQPSGAIEHVTITEWERKFKSRKVLERKLFEITNKRFSIW